MKKREKRWFFPEKSSLPYAALIRAVRKEEVRDLSDESLRSSLRGLSQTGGAQEETPARGFALLTELIRRVTGLNLFDSQLSTALSLQSGKIAELPTGEGKTAAAVLAAAWFALQGRKVHVLSFNDYLAKRDCLFARPVLEACGLSCGWMTQESEKEDRRKQYRCNVVYLSAKEAGFDFLRDFLCMRPEDQLAPRREVAIVDEADSILLDEARIPLVLAGQAPEFTVPLEELVRLAGSLAAEEVNVDAVNNQVFLTDEGIRRVEGEFSLTNLHSGEHADLLAAINTALQAQFLLHKDKNYLVKEEEICIVDEGTGRIAQSRRYPDLLQAAVEAKEGVPYSRRSRIFHSTTLRDFLLQYEFLCGMTGTAKSSEGELENLYDLSVDEIAPHLPSRRIDREDLLFETTGQRDEALAARILEASKEGRPVLVGTRNVKESEALSARLTRLGVSHSVLNARDDEREAEIIAGAGQPGRVTVSTNMAGRGVDIRLGEGDPAAEERARRAGGLLVLGTGLNRCKRIQDQLRGRAGRQGDPGESLFFLSLQEERELLGFELPEGRNYSTTPRGEVEDVWMHKLVQRAQRNAQAKDSEERYLLQRYAFLLEQQRRIVSAWRDAVLFGNQPGCLLENDREKYDAFAASCGAQGVEKADRQLTLYFINLHWADYLESMEAVRDGIHFSVVGRKSPLDEYHRAAIEAFEEMRAEVIADVCAVIRECEITDDGIDMEKYGMELASSTWTCLVEDSASQFSRLPHLIKAITAPLKKAATQISNAKR